MEYVRQLTDPDGCLVPASFRVAESRGRREASRWRAVASREEPVAVERAFCRFCIGLLARDEQTSGGWNQSLHRILDDIVGQIDLDRTAPTILRQFGSFSVAMIQGARPALLILVLLAPVLACLLPGLPSIRSNYLRFEPWPEALVPSGPCSSSESSSPCWSFEGDNFFSKVFAAAAQGCTAAFVAAILSAMCEPLDPWLSGLVESTWLTGRLKIGCEPTPGEANDCGPGIQRDELGTGGQILPHHFSNQHAEIPCLRSHQPSDGIQWTFSQH
eukprot:s66_g19.t1